MVRALGQSPTTSFESLAREFSRHPELTPSEWVTEDQIDKAQTAVDSIIAKAAVSDFLINGAGQVDYPSQLSDAEFPVHLLCMQEDSSLMHAVHSF